MTPKHKKHKQGYEVQQLPPLDFECIGRRLSKEINEGWEFITIIERGGKYCLFFKRLEV